MPGFGALDNVLYKSCNLGFAFSLWIPCFETLKSSESFSLAVLGVLSSVTCHTSLPLSTEAQVN